MPKYNKIYYTIEKMPKPKRKTKDFGIVPTV
jgi:hypothetical protein